MTDQLSSEKIAKALKGAGLSAEQRIATAAEAWYNERLFFPGKDDFILEWLCSALTKPNTKTLADCSLLQVAYWQLLKELLTHYERRARDEQKRPPIIRVKLVNAFSTFLQLAYAEPEKNTPDRIKLLENATACLISLLSDTFQYSYRPPFEQLVTTVEQLLDVLSVQITLSEKKQEERTALDALADFAKVLLKCFDTQIIQAANQRKVFTTITGSMFSKLLSLRRRIATSYLHVAQQITNILLHGLFHPDTILEYTSVLKEVNATESKVFVTKGFEDLRALAGSTDTEEDALDILPTMYGHFIKIFREKRTGSSRDTYRLVEFGFAVEAYNILNKASKSSNQLNCLQRLLQQVLTLNIYVASNDDVSRKQFSGLDEMTEYAVNRLEDGNDETQDVAFRVLATALQIDFSLLENRMSSLWHHLLNPSNFAWKSCLDFAYSVLNMYTASRQIDSFIQELLTSLYEMDIDIHTLLQSPLFSREFMDELTSSISNHMPPAQAKLIYDDLEKRLCETKLDNVIIRATAFYFARFINALKISDNQKRAFAVPLQSLFEKWIKPQLSAKQDDELLPALEIHAALVNTMLDQYWLPFENTTHEWLADTFKSTFSRLISDQNSQDASSTIALTANALLQHAYYTSLFNSECPTNQTTALINTVLDFCCDDSLLRKDAIWDGSLLSIDKHNVKLACFKLLVDEWFMTTSRFVQGERAEKLASLIFLSLFQQSDPEKSNVISITVLSKIVLRSASLYEASFCKDYAVKILLNAIIQHFRQEPQTQTVAKYLSDIDLDLPAAHWSAEQVEALKKSLKNPHPMEGEQGANVIRLVEILCLFPTEYLSKGERQHALLIAFLLDVWMVTHGVKDIETIRVYCRGMLLRIINLIKTAGILETEPDLLDWFLSSVNKENSRLFEETRQVDELVLSAMIKAAAKKGATVHAQENLERVLETRVVWLESNARNAVDWCINAVSVIVEYFERNKARRAEFDPDDNMFAAKAISRISSIVISALQTFKNRLATCLEGQTTVNAVSDLLDRKIFILTSLLQRYARLFDDERAYKVFQTENLTQCLTSLASPLVQCLQQSPSVDRELSNLVANFVASLCNSLAHRNRAEVTERLMAVIWFIYSLALKTGDITCQQSLQTTFTDWIKTLDQQQYKLVLDGFISQSGKTMQDLDGRAVSTLLALLPTVVCTDNEKSSVLRANLYIIVPRLSVIANKAQSLDTILQVTSILKLLTREQSIHLGTYDISLIISCLAQAANPSTAQHLKNQMTSSTARILYFDICSILSNLLHNHRSHLTSILSPFTAILQSLLHCFRTAHLALVRDKSAQQHTGRVFPLLFIFSPLDVEAAKDCSRLLSTFARKPVGGGKLDENIKRAVSRHAPYLLIEYFTIQSNTRMSISQPDIRAALLPGLYDLMDNCRESDRQMILAALDSTGKLLFKSFYSSWKEDHKYTGQ